MPIVRVLDFECSSLSPDDGCVIEVGWADYDTDARTISDPKSYLCHAASLSPDNRAVHHIMPSQLIGKAPFSADALNDQATEDGVSCWAAHNSEFETRWFAPRIPVICTYKSALRAWPDAPSHSNAALRYMLEDMGRCNANYAHCSPPHRAGPDAYVTAHILRELFADGHTGSQMIKWTKEPSLLPRCPIGKFRGKPWAEVEFGFLEWMTRQADMEADFKWNAERELSRRAN